MIRIYTLEGENCLFIYIYICIHTYIYIPYLCALRACVRACVCVWSLASPIFFLPPSLYLKFVYTAA